MTTAADADALRRERMLLLERAACARRASTALAASVGRSCACSAATRDAVARARRARESWRAGLAALGWEPPAHDSAALLLRVLDGVGASAAELAARMPWLDEDAAVEEALARAVASLARELPPEELWTLAGSLRAVVNALHRAAPRDGGARARAARAPGPARSPDHFRPTLRRA
nr:hypothetical protein [uncultured bacterium]